MDTEIQAEFLDDGGQLRSGSTLELMQSRGHHIVNDTDGVVQVSVEEPSNDQHAVADLAFVLDFFPAGDDVVY